MIVIVIAYKISHAIYVIIVCDLDRIHTNISGYFGKIPSENY